MSDDTLIFSYTEPIRMLASDFRKHPIPWSWLIFGLACATVMPLGIHEYMLSVLGVPYPSKADIPALDIWINDTLAYVALLFAVGYAKESIRRYPLWARCMGVALVYAALTETFRGIVMNGLVTTAYAFNVLIAIPFVLCKVALCSGITLLESLSVRWWAKIAGTVMFSALFFVVEPWLENVLALDTVFASLAHAEIYSAPYGWVVNGPSIVTFIEPVLATLAVYLAIKGQLGRTTLIRICQFVLLILILRGRLFSFLTYGIFSKLGYLGFMVAESQFLMEWALLALIIAATVERAVRDPSMSVK